MIVVNLQFRLLNLIPDKDYIMYDSHKYYDLFYKILQISGSLLSLKLRDYS